MTTFLTQPDNTWTFDVNNAAASAGTTYGQAQNTMHEVKKALVGCGMTLISTSNSVSSGASDYLSASTDYVWSTGAHAWFLLQHSSLGYQICVDMNRASLNPQLCDIYFSPTGAFTGGSTTARPTASDEQFAISNSNWVTSVTTVGTQVHAQSSVIGMRLWIYRGGTLLSLWHFDRLVSKVTGVSNTYIFRVDTTTASDTSSLAQGPNAFTIISSTKVSILYGVPAVNAAAVYWSGRTTDLAGPNELESTTPYPASALFYVGNTTSNFGEIGIAEDLYMVSTGLADGDTAPSTGATKKWIVVGNLLIPWDGVSTMSTS